jgi:hypothetical protein
LAILALDQCPCLAETFDSPPEVLSFDSFLMTLVFVRDFVRY